MSVAHYDDSIGWVEGDPHFDTYFADDDAGTESSPLGDVILALETLTERQRFVIECRFGLRPGLDGEGMTYQDIAALMGIDWTTVREHEELAIRRLRSSLTP